ncbi:MULTISPECIES: hypothetical protein [Methylosinus]|uniref:Serine kinase n=1 Tax=Methylosinus trichosporium (strain ATCC 35070 / NCIMB 11131 / UNIQEM 75 / OB3b) TaxID=595536 RepID=A0A2D2CY19_METT3|nr:MULTISPECIES: hypothetical protein [Methylosinus]ATQ67606.1 hypothetical protein CQW49_06670 [Methylosinus trichosporium OB3b]OBS52149.1 hypothetical protein A8B73_12610 [Methylosinus sp. 3S-1]
MRRLFGFGQIIASEAPVPGARDWVGDEATAPGVVIFCDVAAEDAFAAPAGFSREGDALRLAVPGIASYLCSASAIEVTPSAHAKTEEIGERLIAGALPASLWMQGRLVLHAAAVCARPGGPALGILGRSGAGKSTLAAALVADGAALLADDSIAIIPGSGAATVCGLPGGLFLREGSQARRFHPLAADRMIDAARLGALIVLDDAVDEEPMRLSQRKALEVLLAHRHRPNAPALMGLQAAALLHSVEVARSVPVYAWGRRNVMMDRAGRAERLARASIDERIEL